MTSLAPVARGVVRDAARIERAQVRLVPALRGALGVALPLALGTALGQPGPGLGIAIGALNVAFSDQPGAYRGRARRMLLATLGGAGSVLVGASTGGLGPLAVCLTAVWGLAGGLLVALGPGAMQVGLTCTALLIVFGGHPMSFGDALGQALLVAVGGLLQTGLALVAWPLRPLGPERTALAQVFEHLAGLAPPATPAAGPPPLTADMNEVSGLLAELDPTDAEVERLRSLLTQAERIRLGVLAVQDLDVAAPLVIQPALGAIRTVLGTLASQLRTGRSDATGAAQALTVLERSNAALRQAASGDVQAAAVLANLEALSGHLRSALAIASEAEPRAGSADSSPTDAARSGPSNAERQFRDGLATLRANVSLRSAVWRHALRLAACLAAADLLSRWLQLPWPYWVPLTVTVVLRPEFGTTFTRGLGRVIGTFAGLVLATALVSTSIDTTSALRIVLIGLLVFATRALGPANLALGAVALSALVVLLLSLAGDPPHATIVARGLDTVLGGLLAVAAYATWPTWERPQAADRLADLLDAYRRYLAVVLGGYLDPTSVSLPALDACRAEARLARTNALASIARLRAEPAHSRSPIKRADRLLATSNRFIWAAMALEAGLYHAPRSSRPAPAELHDLARDLDTSLRTTIARLRGRADAAAAPASLPDTRADERRLAEALATPRAGDDRATAILAVQADRLATSVETLAELTSAAATVGGSAGGAGAMALTARG